MELSLPKVRTPSVFKIAKEVHNLARLCVGSGNLNSNHEHKSGSSARLSKSLQPHLTHSPVTEHAFVGHK